MSLDFFQIASKETKKGVEIRPDFIVGRSKDLMVRGQSFYAVWDEEIGLWSTDEYDVRRLVDQEVEAYADKLRADGVLCDAKYLRSFGNNGWAQFRKFMKNVSDNSHQLDTKIVFANTKVEKSDHVSRRLPYDLAPGDHSAWNELLDTLYAPEEREKIEWALGAVISGDAKKIQKFLVFYGPPGSGKGTVLEIIQKIFAGYYAMFEAKALVSSSHAFATEAFKTNPLVAIQHDGDLSKIEDNSILNSIVGHDEMRINEKYKPGYDMRIGAFLFMGTNKPVKITDGKSGLIRRLIDVNPSGRRLDPDHYFALMQRVEFELGAIANHCLGTYRSMGKNYYNGYRPINMMLKTDVFFNYIEANFDIFKAQDYTTLKQAWELYKEYVKEAELEYKLTQIKFREELKNYFEEFVDRGSIDGIQARSIYRVFTAQPFREPVKPPTTPPSFSLVLDEEISILDELLAHLPAQYAKKDGTPTLRWDSVTTHLQEIDTTKLHYVKVPSNHIVIDFDLKDSSGVKSLEENLRAASKWPATYAELSKSGGGVHLHYLYEGDTALLDSRYSDGIEIKVYTGNASLRRMRTRCNNIAVTTISSGLPFKEKKPVLENKTIQSEKGLRALIEKNLKKEVHPGTKPSIDFIHKILDDAYNSGLPYDVTNMRSRVMAFAGNSSNHALECMRVVRGMKFKSEVSSEVIQDVSEETRPALADDRLVFFDVEVYPNLFVICWKYEGTDTVVRMINPTPTEVEQLFKFKLVGFNNRRYDNHILWARFLGYTNEELFTLSSRIINDKGPNAMFGEAYNLSYADIFDFSSIKKGLKKFQIDLGIHHVEMEIPWDQPVPQDKVMDVVEYCCNDVVSTEAVFNYRHGDFVARQILAELSGLPVNSTTQKHTAKIIFGDDRNPQKQFVYTDLSEEFPSYKFDFGKSTYRDEAISEGGYIYAEPGIYENVALLDVASMHPTSINILNVFGNYTEKFWDLVQARLAIKKRDYDSASKMLDGRLDPFLRDREDNYDINAAKALSDALKIVINIVYGLTSAKFDNPFRDIRNKDNIVAKRGALFMVDLKHEVQKRGFTVAHIKTDSIKIPNATPAIIQFVTEFGAKYGYVFEHEATYTKFCLVNDAVYIAYTGETDPPGGYEKKWTATGAQFAQSYVFKTLFTGEPLNFSDLCEPKAVSQGVMYLDFGDGKATINGKYDRMHHVGKTGLFIPVQENAGGGVLLRIKDEKPYAVTGTKGYYWIEAEMIKQLNGDALDRMPFENINEALEGTGSLADIVDMTYFERLAEEAMATINKFGSFEEFVK